LLDTAVKSYEEFLTLTKNRYDSGVASMGDVAQAQTQLETARAQLIDLGVQRAQFEHAIAIPYRPAARSRFGGSGAAYGDAAGSSRRPAVRTSERRPDVAAAERLVAAANEQIGIAQVALYPALTIAPAEDLKARPSPTGSAGRAVSGRWVHNWRRRSSKEDGAGRWWTRPKRLMTSRWRITGRRC
jgi:Outer membrane protein